MSATAAASALPGHGFGHRRRLPMLLQTESAECGLASVAMAGCVTTATADGRHALARD
jgi:hypothetical protein